MSRRMKCLVGIAVVLMCVGAVAVVKGTPTVGQVFSLLSSGVIQDDILQKAEVPLPAGTAGSDGDADRDDRWTAKLHTSGPANFQVLDVTLLPGGRTGWHSHPGILLATLISGSLNWYDAQCVKHVYNAGDSWTENTQIHDVFNAGTANAHFTATYIIANGQARRIDQPQPSCGAAQGLE